VTTGPCYDLVRITKNSYRSRLVSVNTPYANADRWSRPLSALSATVQHTIGRRTERHKARWRSKHQHVTHPPLDRHPDCWQRPASTPSTWPWLEVKCCFFFLLFSSPDEVPRDPAMAALIFRPIRHRPSRLCSLLRPRCVVLKMFSLYIVAIRLTYHLFCIKPIAYR